MAKPTQPHEHLGSISPSRLRLTTGLGRLEKWSEDASQVERNAVDEALFAVVDRSVFHRYLIIDDEEQPTEFLVLVRDELVLKIEIYDFDTFGVRYVGPVDDAFASIPGNAG